MSLSSMRARMLQRKKEREGLEAEISKSVAKSQTTVPGIFYEPSLLCHVQYLMIYILILKH